MKILSKIIAHRGFWRSEGSAQNSIASLKGAGDAGLFAVELDVRLTSDLYPLVFHDRHIGKYYIEMTPFETLKPVHIVNGETIPLFSDYLECALLYPALKLIVEIKPSGNPALETQAVESVVSLIKKYHLENRVEFISFSATICTKLRQKLPSVPAASLSKELSPAQVKALGLTGVDYDYNVLRDRPHWIDEAHALNLTVNVWIVNHPNIIRKLALQGVDYITTDNPLAAQQVIDSLNS